MKIEIKDLDSRSQHPVGAVVEAIVTNDYGEILFEFLLDEQDNDKILRRQAEYLKKRKEKAKAEEREKAIIEELAALEHEQWSRWSKPVADCEPISIRRRERWESSWIPYSLLSEETKEDDRKWARKALKIVRKADTFLPRKGRKIEVKND